MHEILFGVTIQMRPLWKSTFIGNILSHGTNLQQEARKCDRILLIHILWYTDLIQSEASWKLSSTSDWLMSARKNVS